VTKGNNKWDGGEKENKLKNQKSIDNNTRQEDFWRKQTEERCLQSLHVVEKPLIRWTAERKRWAGVLFSFDPAASLLMIEIPNSSAD
jgi:hypothetical protein